MGEAFNNYLMEHHGILHSGDAFHWDIQDSYGDIDTNKMFHAIWETPLAPTSGAKRFLAFLAEQGVETHILSHRRDGSARDAALRDIDVNFGKHIDSVHIVSNSTDEKLPIIQKLAAGRDFWGFVDDKWKTAFDVSRNTNYDTYLLDKTYNQCLDINTKYVRVHSLNDLQDLLFCRKCLGFNVNFD
jgi:hypothetical protein